MISFLSKIIRDVNKENIFGLNHSYASSRPQKYFIAAYKLLRQLERLKFLERGRGSVVSILKNNYCNKTLAGFVDAKKKLSSHFGLMERCFVKTFRCIQCHRVLQFYTRLHLSVQEDLRYIIVTPCLTRITHNALSYRARITQESQRDKTRFQITEKLEFWQFFRRSLRSFSRSHWIVYRSYEKEFCNRLSPSLSPSHTHPCVHGFQQIFINASRRRSRLFSRSSMLFMNIFSSPFAFCKNRGDRFHSQCKTAGNWNSWDQQVAIQIWSFNNEHRLALVVYKFVSFSKRFEPLFLPTYLGHGRSIVV